MADGMVDIILTPMVTVIVDMVTETTIPIVTATTATEDTVTTVTAEVRQLLFTKASLVEVEILLSQLQETFPVAAIEHHFQLLVQSIQVRF